MKSQTTMRAKIYAPYRTYFEGDITSLSAEDKTGPFDILPGHKNFMSLLVPCNITVRRNHADDVHLSVSRGVMHVKADKVTVFLDV